MLIRSQDKRKLCVIRTLEILEKVKVNAKREREVVGFYILTGDKEEALIIGEYSTEEKAIKVLDMIEDAYNKCFAFTMGNDGYYHEVRENKVFQMPQDNEV